MEWLEKIKIKNVYVRRSVGIVKIVGKIRENRLMVWAYYKER